jgi:deferrochelatase/peroxidase EfeB
LGPETGARDSLAGAAIRLSRCDDPAPGGDERRNNDFEFGEDSDQRKCPYAAHIRKVYPRDDVRGGEAEVTRPVSDEIYSAP